MTARKAKHRDARLFTEKQRAATMAEMLDKGRRVAEVAAEYHLSEPTLYAWLKKAREAATAPPPPPRKETRAMKKKRRRRQFDEAFRETAARRVLSGEAFRAVAREHHLAESVLRGWVKRLRATPKAKLRPVAAGSANGHHVFVVHAANWSSIGLFGDELAALRHAVANGLTVQTITLPVENLRKAEAS